MYPSALREFLDRYLMALLVPIAWVWYLGVGIAIYIDLRLFRHISDNLFALGLMGSFLVLVYDHFFRIK